jgi:hypothetical protein
VEDLSQSFFLPKIQIPHLKMSLEGLFAIIKDNLLTWQISQFQLPEEKKTGNTAEAERNDDHCNGHQRASNDAPLWRMGNI